MSQIVYCLVIENEDNIPEICFFQDEDLVQFLLENDTTFDLNDGMAYELTFPDKLDLDACGFEFSDDDFIQDLEYDEEENETDE